MKAWLENFWYYHKWHFMFTIFALFLLILAISQFVGKEHFDYNVVLYTSLEVQNDTCETMAREFERFGEDINGDGEVKVQIINCGYNPANAEMRMAQTGKFQANLAAPETVLIITDSANFSLLDSQGAFEAFQGFPDKNGEAIDLAQTVFNAKIKSDMPAEYFLSKRVYNENAKEYTENSAVLLRKMLSEYTK